MLKERAEAALQRAKVALNNRQTTIYYTNFAGSVSADAAVQAWVWSELGLMLATATNNFLLREADAGRLDVLIVTRALIDHEAKYRTPVFEFWVDLETQLQIVTSNYKSILFHPAFQKNKGHTDLTLTEEWPNLIGNITSGFLCHPDSIVLGSIKNVQTILQMLCAPAPILEAWHVLHCKVHQAMDDNTRAGRVSGVAPRYHARTFPPPAGAEMYRKREAPSRHYGGLADAEVRMRLRRESVLPNEAHELPPSPAVPEWRVVAGAYGIPKQNQAF
jgi:hypothetical protein